MGCLELGVSELENAGIWGEAREIQYLFLILPLCSYYRELLKSLKESSKAKIDKVNIISNLMDRLGAHSLMNDDELK